MRLKKGLPRLTSSKAVFRTFLATLKQSYSCWIVDCRHDFEQGKHLENTFKWKVKLPSSVCGYDVISDSWFLILKMNGYLAASFCRFLVLERQELIKDRKTKSRRLASATWRQKSYEKRQLKLKYHLLKRKCYKKL